MLTSLQRQMIRLASEEETLRSPLLDLLAGYKGNPDGKDIYKNEVDHGYDQALSGGHDIMKRLQDKLLHEQGRPERDKNPRLAETA